MEAMLQFEHWRYHDGRRVLVLWDYNHGWDRFWSYYRIVRRWLPDGVEENPP